jgi:hypothetical protein
MYDGSYLKGACVRDSTGVTGRLLAVAEDHFQIGWDLPHTTVPREEKLERSADRFQFGVEVLTLDKGWAPIGLVLPAPASPSNIVAEVRAILDEDSDHNPFKNRANLGPGPRGHTHTKKKRWECSGSGYEQVCIGIAEDNQGKILRISIDPAYKAEYNQQYKRWVRDKRRAEKLERRK